MGEHELTIKVSQRGSANGGTIKVNSPYAARWFTHALKQAIETLELGEVVDNMGRTG